MAIELCWLSFKSLLSTFMLRKVLRNALYMIRMFDVLSKVWSIINKCGYMWLNGVVAQVRA